MTSWAKLRGFLEAYKRYLSPTEKGFRVAPELRKERLKLDNYKCCNCGEPASQVHHVVALSLGGLDTLTNLVSLCDACHGKVHGRSAVDVSALTKVGLAAAKARGVKLGGPRPHNNRKRKERADRFATQVAPLVLRLREEGANLRETAEALNEAGLTTPRGKRWRPTQVARVLGRLHGLKTD